MQSSIVFIGDVITVSQQADSRCMMVRPPTMLVVVQPVSCALKMDLLP